MEDEERQAAYSAGMRLKNPLINSAQLRQAQRGFRAVLVMATLADVSVMACTADLVTEVSSRVLTLHLRDKGDICARDCKTEGIVLQCCLTPLGTFSTLLNWTDISTQSAPPLSKWLLPIMPWL